MKHPETYTQLKALSLPPGDDRKEVIRLRMLCLRDGLTDDDMETANALIDKYTLVYECSECDWKGTPRDADNTHCPRCGRDAVYAEDFDSDYPRVFNPGLTEEQNINRLMDVNDDPLTYSPSWTGIALGVALFSISAGYLVGTAYYGR